MFHSLHNPLDLEAYEKYTKASRSYVFPPSLWRLTAEEVVVAFKHLAQLLLLRDTVQPPRGHGKGNGHIGAKQGR